MILERPLFAPAFLAVRISVQRLGKFGVVGLSGVAVNMAIFWLLTSRLGLHYLLASPLANEVAICSNYLLNNNWTFADRKDGFLSLSGLARYHAVSVGGIVISLATLQVLAGILGIRPMLANLVGITLAIGWNYALNVRWTWRRETASTVTADLETVSGVRS